MLNSALFLCLMLLGAGVMPVGNAAPAAPKSVPAIKIAPMPKPTPAQPTPQPVDDGKSLLESLKGKTYVLKDGKLVKQDARLNAKHFIFYFSASWCGPCCATVPHSVELYNKHIKDNPALELIMCSRDHSPQLAEAWAVKNKMPWVILHKADETAQVHKLRGTGIPWMVLTDRDGKVIDSCHGMRMEQLLNKVIPPAESGAKK